MIKSLVMEFDFGRQGKKYFSTHRIKGLTGCVNCIEPNFFIETNIPLTFKNASFRAQVGRCNIISTNQNNLDYLIKLYWPKTPYKAYIGDKNASFSDYELVSSGAVLGYGWTEKKITINLGSYDQTLEVSFPEKDIAGNDAATGQTMPYLIGKVFNFAPVVMSNQIYDFGSDYLSASEYSLSEVRNNGVALTNMGLITDLSTVNPTDTQYYYNHGQLKCGPSVGQITLDFLEVNGALPSTFQNVVTRLINKHAPEMNFNFVGLDYEIGWNFEQRGTLKDAIYYLCSRLDLYPCFTPDGFFLIKKRGNAVTDSTDFIVSERNIINGSIKLSSDINEYSEYKVGYKKNWTKQNPETLPQAGKVLYTREYRYATENYPNAILGRSKPRTINTPLANEVDAKTIGELVGRDGRPKYHGTMKVRDVDAVLSAGKIISFDHSRIPFKKAEILYAKNFYFKDESLIKVLGIE